MPDDLIAAGTAVKEDFDKFAPNTRWPTTTAAQCKALQVEGDKQAPFRTLRKLAETGFPCASQGAEREVVRYGKKRMQRPWVWAQCAQEQFDEWAAKIRAEPSKVGPYVAIEKRLRELEERVATLEAALSART
jgi:hypothetical protein